MRAALLAVVEALFRLLFTFECVGEERIPATGGAVVASNHPSYLDPVLLSLRARRPIRFMAWDALFRVPLVGALARAFGAFPVDVRKGHGRAAYERARQLVREGEVVGIFPEGKRSRTGWMEQSLREGAARLAWETGAPLVPATITGAYRAWPHFQSLPRPARIRVRFHAPIEPSAWAGLPEEEALSGLLAELRRRVEKTLRPGIKADLRTTLLYRQPAPPPRAHELLAAASFAVPLLVVGHPRTALPALGYLAYLVIDRLWVPASRLAKWVRNGSPILFWLAFGPTAMARLGLPVPAGEALAAVVLGAAFAYLYERGRRALAFVRGFVLAVVLEACALALVPSGLGPHLALPAYAAACGVSRRTVFWRWSAAALVVYGAVVFWLLGGSPPLLVHALAGLAAAAAERLLPLPGGARPAPAGAGLQGRPTPGR